MKLIKRPLSHYVTLLRRREPFALARYGDGEWLTLLGFTGRRNSNGCTFTPALRADLLRVLEDPQPYDHGMLKIALHKKRFEHEGVMVEYDGRKRIDAFLKERGLAFPWVDGDVLLNEMLAGRLFPLIEQIRERRVLYVSGNDRLHGLNHRGAGFFPYVLFVDTPPQNSHRLKDAILDVVSKAIERHRIDFVGWSCGLAAKVLLDEVYRRFPEVTQTDFGSIFDGYFKPMPHVRPNGSRSYIRKGGHDWEALRKANTGNG